MTPKEKKLLYSSLDGPLPRRKSKPKPDLLAHFEPYLALRAAVLSGKMKPMEEKGFFITPADAQEIGTKFPARMAVDRIRGAIRAAGLQADMHVHKYETDSPGVWWIGVRYEPPRVKGSRD